LEVKDRVECVLNPNQVGTVERIEGEPSLQNQRTRIWLAGLHNPFLAWQLRKVEQEEPKTCFVMMRGRETKNTYLVACGNGMALASKREAIECVERHRADPSFEYRPFDWNQGLE